MSNVKGKQRDFHIVWWKNHNFVEFRLSLRDYVIILCNTYYVITPDRVTMF